VVKDYGAPLFISLTTSAAITTASVTLISTYAGVQPKLLTKDEARRIAANIAKLPNVRFGSKADIHPPSADVCFIPESGHGPIQL
jgi:hypothetical protein